MQSGASRVASARRHTAKGRVRRQALLHAARTLLADRALDQLTLPMIAENAGIPASSAYHFYPDLVELYKDLAGAISEEMAEYIPSQSEAQNWESVVREVTSKVRDFLNADGAALQLLNGPKTNPEIKAAGCGNDLRFGVAVRQLIARSFELPTFPNQDEVFFRAIQISDLLFSLSVAKHGLITDEYFEDGSNAMLAYLSLYIPKLLARRPNKPVLVALDDEDGLRLGSRGS
ncbi:MAG TPA: TetR/AcrR family transcriptional regulator [Phenylobacterium sp.]|uniref:TetR/AcrR family transcriptional regulator n=1 Tax=Phenylobacterium sp. TaxID=1871053 RepID=UPI002B478875|nr:TetR/AcrR family transcriptional regulator [Phenylobacterium sp.]HKR87109.1 TetR/AcrR family transcriptional regulator [Phenylobacterium sp.]HKT54754.1 TetR/AcrR family transcriptional regulator [Caulobacteraceae bacterium]